MGDAYRDTQKAADRYEAQSLGLLLDKLTERTRQLFEAAKLIADEAPIESDDYKMAKLVIGLFKQKAVDDRRFLP